MRYFNPNNLVRPMWEDVSSGGEYIQCTCGSILQTVQATREHWQDGHFDIPDPALKGEKDV